jgi:putative hydrolase of the HAD superfamily
MSHLSEHTLSPLSPPKAIFFDLDDTLLAYGAAAKLAWEEMCHRYAVRVNGGDAVGLNQAIRVRADWFWRDATRHRQGRCAMVATRASIIAFAIQSFGVDDPTLAHEMAAVMTTLHGEYMQPFPGAISMLEQLRAAGIRLGLITNGDKILQYQKIDRFALRDHFEILLVEGEFGVGKPDLTVFQHALQALKLAPQQAWMVGDNLAFDIAPAQQLGIRAIWHDHRQVGLPEDATIEPDLIIHEITDILRLCCTKLPSNA